MTHQKKDEIAEEVSALSGATPGSKEWMTKYQASLQVVVDRLTPEEVAEYERLAQEWNSETPDSKVQQT